MSKAKHKGSNMLAENKRRVTVTGAVIAVLLIAFLLAQSTSPARSVEAYCKAYTEEKARLAKLPGDTYPSELFDDYLSDAGEIATSVGRMEKVAPDEIRPDVTTLKSFYEKLDKDPSQLLSVSIAAQPVDKHVSNWTKQNCQ